MSLRLGIAQIGRILRFVLNELKVPKGKRLLTAMNADHPKAALLGLAIGDALGTSVEFQSRGAFPPVTDMTGGGLFNLPVGAWTDDTSIALTNAKDSTHGTRWTATCDGTEKPI